MWTPEIYAITLKLALDLQASLVDDFSDDGRRGFYRLGSIMGYLMEEWLASGTSGQPVTLTKAVCECGDFDTDHAVDGHCKICAWNPMPYCCKKFRFAHYEAAPLRSRPQAEVAG